MTTHPSMTTLAPHVLTEEARHRRGLHAVKSRGIFDQLVDSALKIPRQERAQVLRSIVTDRTISLATRRKFLAAVALAEIKKRPRAEIKKRPRAIR
jgi:hypothetical protein